LQGRTSSSTFPFCEDAFTLLVESAASKTPRFLNKLCDVLLREFESASEGELGLRRTGIPMSLVEKRLPSVLASLEEARG
jgi:hypothetical protein